MSVVKLASIDSTVSSYIRLYVSREFLIPWRLALGLFLKNWPSPGYLIIKLFPGVRAGFLITIFSYNRGRSAASHVLTQRNQYSQLVGNKNSGTGEQSRNNNHNLTHEKARRKRPSWSFIYQYRKLHFQRSRQIPTRGCDSRCVSPTKPSIRLHQFVPFLRAM